MTAAYFTEAEIIRALLPGMTQRAAKAVFETWKLHPAFPKVDKITGRRWMPAIEQWINRLEGVSGTSSNLPAVTLDPRRGERIDEAYKARQARRPRNSGPHIQAPSIDVAHNVVATIGPGGKRLSKDAIPSVAAEREPDPAA